jgi:Raf kinase inhibitor-like YbhB/YbcL family protein
MMMSVMKPRLVRTMSLAMTCLLFVMACDQSTSPRTPGTDVGGLTVSSGAFQEGAPIPIEYSCDGQNIQLPVSWTRAPSGIAEYELVMDDQDANGFIHWVVVGIPAEASALANPLPQGAVNGLNGRGQAGYTGPCPPSGTHHYRITVYGVNAPLGLGSSASGDQVRTAAAGKTLASGTLTGTYAKAP